VPATPKYRDPGTRPGSRAAVPGHLRGHLRGQAYRAFGLLDMA
jgi:hypothetical protein